MTTDKTPSDEELRAVLTSLPLVDKPGDMPIAFARAVLAKWGSPVVAGEPIGYINRGIAPHTQGKVVFHEKPTENLEGRWWMPDQPVYTTPQPTQAQAGAVPLTAKQMEAGREAIFSTGNPYCPCDSKTFRKVAEWVERHHGIKEGGQHAAD